MADCAPLLDEELSSFVFNYLTENSGSQVRPAPDAPDPGAPQPRVRVYARIPPAARASGRRRASDTRWMGGFSRLVGSISPRLRVSGAGCARANVSSGLDVSREEVRSSVDLDTWCASERVDSAAGGLLL
ncbi:hypothetical protein EYF80_027265 [Liparis tanakae]|uniref:Uncharacterized protein n=1 Tax=Liparis tanakae TaxID=230148 RepID=A0A4Z2HCQ9_9TELE|nr:hypothetical protein EYF80_027265 [Liparis tanakae]